MTPRPRRVQRVHRRGSNGQVVVIFALTFVFFIMGLMMLVLNTAVLYQYDALLRKTAQDSAIAGASNADTATFRATGKVRICGCGSNTSAKGLGPLPGSLASTTSNPCERAMFQDLTVPPASAPGATYSLFTASCTVGGPNNGTITVVVSMPVKLPMPVGIGSVTMTRTYTAFAQCGTNTATPVGC